MNNTICFIGHRKINDNSKLHRQVKQLIVKLIDNGATNFLFGDHSMFNDLCYDTVTELKKEYPFVRRIHYRKDYENANEYTMSYLKQGYEESICPKGIGNAGRSSYIQRNNAMIKRSDICIFYYDISNQKIKSGTEIAYKYAKRQNKNIINIFDYIH